jgi:hypothetical protein
VRALSTAALLAAWESAMGEPAVDRAPALLRPLGLVEAGCDPSGLTVGACDLILLDLRSWLFGTDLDVVATCPACRDVVELVIPCPDLVPAAREEPGASADQPAPADQPRQVTVEEDGLLLQCRVPTNGDLRQLAGLGRPATVADLLERCVKTIEGPNAPPTAAGLPGAVAERVADALAASDPGADIVAEIKCPCGNVWAESVDIRAMLWAELTGWVQRRLAEVHQLASAYGWAERDILEMSPYRRRFYLEACAG